MTKVFVAEPREPEEVKVVTASRLGDGVVVWLNEEQDWSEDLNLAAQLRSNAEVVAALETARASVARREVVDPYALEVRDAAEGLEPLRLRERIRAAGPTVRPDFAKGHCPASA